jgi:hypothetical protein
MDEAGRREQSQSSAGRFVRSSCHVGGTRGRGGHMAICSRNVRAWRAQSLAPSSSR